ncbi:MAG: hypothetical protein ACOCUI_00880 [bacterium]
MTVEQRILNEIFSMKKKIRSNELITAERKQVKDYVEKLNKCLVVLGKENLVMRTGNEDSVKKTKEIYRKSIKK